MLTIVIISHGHEHFLPRCLASLPSAIAGVETKLIIVDNLGTTAMKDVAASSRVAASVIVNPRPLGFAANSNQGIRASQSPYVLLLNPDTAFLSGSLRDAIQFMDQNPSAGVLGCRMVDAQGREEENYRRFPTFPVFAARLLGADQWSWQPPFYREGMLQRREGDGLWRVDLVTGAFFLIRRECFDAIGGFDSNFFLYYEDADFCARARKAGMATYLFPGITLLHEHQRASRSIAKPHARWHLRSALRYFNKHGYWHQPRA